MTTMTKPPVVPGRVVSAMNSPELEWTRPRAMRRRLVPLSVALTAVLLATLAISARLATGNARAPGAAWPAVGSLVAVVAIAVGWMIVTGWLNASVRGTADALVAILPGGHDERQRALHDAAVRKCYWPMKMLFAISMVTLAVQRPDVVTGLTVFMATFFTAVMAPLWLLSWTLPDEPISADD